MPARKKSDWKAAAERLGDSIARERLHPGVLRWAAGRRAHEPWIVAVSGGADSVALLLLLWQHWPERRKDLVAVHFNHRLRGRAADADERFCEKIARSLGIKWQSARWRDAPPDASEAQARAARHAFFSEVLRVRKAQVLWLGHQQDDIAENLLMRVARGSGTAGLCAPRPVHVIGKGRVHVRPLLSLQKKQISEALASAGVRWRTDATNASRRFLRNRIRTSVVPVWQTAVGERDALAGAALSRELLEEDNTALEQWLDELRVFAANGALNLQKLRKKPRAIVRRALRTWLARHCPEVALSRQAFERLLDDVAAVRQTRHSLGLAGFAEVRGTRLNFASLRGKKTG